MTLRTQIEIADWLKIVTIAGMLVCYGVMTKKDVEAQGNAITRIESKVDGLLISNARMAVFEEKLDELGKRIARVDHQ